MTQGGGGGGGGPTMLTTLCGESPSRVPAILPHEMLHSIVRKIVFASQTLMSQEQHSTSKLCYRNSKNIIFIKLLMQNQKLKCIDIYSLR